MPASVDATAMPSLLGIVSYEFTTRAWSESLEECQMPSDAQVYRKDLFLAVQQQLKTAGEYEERRRLKRRVDSTVTLVSATKMRLKIRGSNSIQLQSFWRSRLCGHVSVSLCQLDVWLWNVVDILANHQLPPGHLAHAHVLVLCLRRSCSLLPSSCHSGIGTLKMSVPWQWDLNVVSLLYDALYLSSLSLHLLYLYIFVVSFSLRLSALDLRCLIFHWHFLPILLGFPLWYDRGALAEANDAQRVQMMEARLDTWRVAMTPRPVVLFCGPSNGEKNRKGCWTVI